jgi:hypothetical protein
MKGLLGYLSAAVATLVVAAAPAWAQATGELAGRITDEAAAYCRV